MEKRLLTERTDIRNELVTAKIVSKDVSKSEDDSNYFRTTRNAESREMYYAPYGRYLTD